MGTKKEARHHAEIATATPQGPKQIRVVCFTGCYKAAIGEHDVGLDKTVAGESILPSEISMSTAKRQARDTGGGDDAERYCLTEQMSSVIDFTSRATWTDPDRSVFRVDADTFHGRQIKDQTVFHATKPRSVMTTAADSDAQLLVACKIHGSNNI